jgi:predicted O-methyltransferase YrrM
MSTRSDSLGEPLAQYLHDLARRREDPLLAELRKVTAALPMARMQISVEQGLFLGMLARLLKVERCLEVGVFTGYSSLCVARELPRTGRLIACDVSEEWTAIARRFWQRAGVAERVELRLGPGAETLARLIADGQAGRFDLAFLDADKEGQNEYYEQCLVLLRPGGMLAIDNAFLGGDVVGATEGTAALVRELTEHAFEDERVEPSLLPIGDGLLLARKR